MEPVNYQFSALIMAIFNGMVIAFWYDIYRLIKSAFNFRGMVAMFGDFFFWVISTMITIIVLFVSSWGDVRFYVFCAMVVGAWFYFTAFSGLVLQTFLKPVKILAGLIMRRKLPVPRVGVRDSDLRRQQGNNII